MNNFEISQKEKEAFKKGLKNKNNNPQEVLIKSGVSEAKDNAYVPTTADVLRDEREKILKEIDFEISQKEKEAFKKGLKNKNNNPQELGETASKQSSPVKSVFSADVLRDEREKILKDAKAIAEEWVTPMRLNHVLDKLGNPTEIEKTGIVIKAMIEDVTREAKGEIKESKQAMQFIGKKTAELYKRRISKI